MPLLLAENLWVKAPLEETYLQAYGGMPHQYQAILNA